MNTYFPILIMMIIAAVFVASMIVLSIFIGPKRITDKKAQPFECGTIGSGDASQRFGVKYYLVAVLFILFDIEIMFLYPWVVNVKELGWPVFYAIVAFLGVVELALIYVWRRGVLNWL